MTLREILGDSWRNCLWNGKGAGSDDGRCDEIDNNRGDDGDEGGIGK